MENKYEFFYSLEVEKQLIEWVRNKMSNERVLNIMTRRYERALKYYETIF